MKDILFRGKRIDTGEWVYGYYAKARDIITEEDAHIIFPLDLIRYPGSEFDGHYEVIPRTVGQFIGLVDKNGKKIFERDIIRASIDWCGDGFYEEGTLTVWYDKRVVGFDISGIDMNTVEVIGNNIDNLELIRGT